MTPTLVFDIETIPDVDGLRRLHRLPVALADADVVAWALQQRRAATGGDFLPLYLHRWLRCVRDAQGNVSRLVTGQAHSNRAYPSLLRRDRPYAPQLVSWNGGGFDLPVLNHRALIHGVTAAKFWDWGDDDANSNSTAISVAIHAPSRFDGRAGDVSAARVGVASTSWHACAASRATRHRRHPGSRSLPPAGSTRYDATARPMR
jgi:hypothetical protein